MSGRTKEDPGPQSPQNGSSGATGPRGAWVRALERLFLESSQAVVVTDLCGAIVDANPQHGLLTGYSRDELIGQNPRVMKSGVHDAGFYRQMWREIVEKGRWEGEIWDRRKNGELYAKWLIITAIHDDQGRPLNYLGMFHDVTKTKQDQSRLEYLAHYDAVTKLPNRILFIDRLVQAIARAERNRLQVAVVFIDMDGFKAVNDRHGHRAGDTLLYLVAERLRATVRQMDTVARLGGDEFTAVVPDIKDEQDAALIAEKLREAFKAPFAVEGGLSIQVTASIGIALYPVDGTDVDSLLKHSDLAMYRAKQDGKDRFRFYRSRLA